MKKIVWILSLLAVVHTGAQTRIADVLSLIENNNDELKASAQVVLGQKATASAENSLEDPTFGFSHLWGQNSVQDRKYEISVSQTFDFPSVYVSRNRLKGLKYTLYDTQQVMQRQQVLLQAKELCLQVVYLNRHIELAEKRQEAADRLAALYRNRLESGEANILDVNKIEIEQLNVATAYTRLVNERNACLARLQVMNGGEAIPGLESLVEYTAEELPASFEEWKEQTLQSAPELQLFRQNNRIAEKEISLSKAGWIPRFELGYRHAYELGERFNGLTVGVSIPLFANRKQVKIARAQAIAETFTADYQTLQVSEALQTAYQEAISLKANLDRYSRLASSNQFQELQTALTAWQISMVESMRDATQFYEAFENQLSLEYEYHLRLARLYKYSL